MIYFNLNIQVYQRCDAVLLQSKKVLDCLTVKIKTLRSSKRRGIPKEQFLQRTDLESSSAAVRTSNFEL
jgi:hypothetical protein